jgi:uncharacterized protein (DUF362 family)
LTSIYDEFESELQQLQKRTVGQPQREMTSLFLTALEREELVSVSYRESVISNRLSKAGLPDDARDLFINALLWIWKDEEMHSIYIRGAILKRSRTWQRVWTFLHQFSGAIGGWASSVMQHTSWSAAPASRGLAELLSFIGVLVNKVPKQVRSHLEFGSFKDFCLFNIEAERTAWLCWQRLVELSERESLLNSNAIRDMQRIARDEENHRRIFNIISDCLTENDTLKDGETAASIAGKMAEVGRAFLPQKLRGENELTHPLGSGGAVYVLRDERELGATALFRETLKRSRLIERIAAIAHALGKSVDQLEVAIKTSFMLGYHKGDLSPIVSPNLVEELAKFLAEHNIRKIAVLESPNLYDRICANRSVAEVASYFGFGSTHYELVDTGKDQVPFDFQRGLSQYTISKAWKDADFRISFGKLRSHPTAAVHLTIGNLDALGSRCDEFIFLERQAQLDTSVVIIADAFPPHFAILDAYENIPDGIVGVMGCKRPLAPRRFYAANDALALDAVAARHVGIVKPQWSGLLRTACHWFGNPLPYTHVEGVDEPISAWCGPFADEFSTALSLVAYPVYELASARGALFLPEMDKSAFPLLDKPSVLQSVARRILRQIVGLQGIIK